MLCYSGQHPNRAEGRQSVMGRLTDKITVVTGAGRGAGRSTAAALPGDVEFLEAVALPRKMPFWGRG